MTHVRALIPAFRYDDAPAAIEFLCRAFGFEKHAVYEGTTRAIEHAELKLGNIFIMLGSAGGEGDWPAKTPGELGGVTGGTYIVLDSDDAVDAHYVQAKAAGAKIVREPVSHDYGGRGYSAADSEGYLWSFGSYDPGAAP
jgi:uncharacterized glyoxalase superfamily protein PhnB